MYAALCLTRLLQTADSVFVDLMYRTSGDRTGGRCQAAAVKVAAQYRQLTDNIECLLDRASL